MMRGDMDGLPLKEKSGLAYASTVTQKDPISGKVAPVMHACGHDVHITSLIGIAKQMAERRDSWSGTLMLIGQPAEERIMGARLMMEDNLWQRFGQPDYALAFHVAASMPSGLINVQEGSPMAGSDSVDIIIHGVGAHGASPHAGKDPSYLAARSCWHCRHWCPGNCTATARSSHRGFISQWQQAQYNFRSSACCS